MQDLILCLMGPTAAGKTDIACQWMEQLPCEIVSVDSAMIYQDMNIGTAKPSHDILKTSPHHLIDICPPTATYSAAQFCEDVRQVSQGIQARGNIPLLVGGTMMYFRALQQGLAVLPPADEVLRAELVAQHLLHGTDYMHQWLKQVDPHAALRIHAHDTQRTQRALEVYLLTKRPLSDYFAEASSTPQSQFINLSLFPQNRAWLHERIALRFQSMLAAGFLDEVRYLVEHWHVSRMMSSMRSVGYRQALDYLEGMIDYTTFNEQGMAATRQLAKRQLTWLKRWPNMHYYDPEDADVAENMLHFVKQRLTAQGL